MRDFEEEMRRGLDEVVVRVDSSEWVNDEDKIARQLRIDPVEQKKVEDEVSESVDGLPVKDVELVNEEDQNEIKGHEFNIRRGGESEETDEAPSEVPDGNIREVLNWVDGDDEKAKIALKEEEAKDDPRKTLVIRLREIIEG